jgi:protein-arginine kinase activator protein McsA
MYGEFKCDKCKEEIATVHLTRYVRGEYVKTHLCEKCKEGDDDGSIMDLWLGTQPTD